MIKFRAWDEPNKEMLDAETGAFLYETDNGLICGYHATDNTPNIDAGEWVICPVMQFSGLKDSLGTDIYEGDKVYIAGYGILLIEFPFLELYEASFHGDIGKIVGCKYK